MPGPLNTIDDRIIAERAAMESAVEKIKAVADRVRGNPYMDRISRVEVTLTAAEILALADSY